MICEEVMAFKKKQLIIKIKREDLPNPRLGVKPTKRIKIKTDYTRKKKHKNKDNF
jgi:hypothetical protein